MSTRIVHLSDLHFGSEVPGIVQALLDDINADPPDLVAISGDLTLGARIGEFRAARAFIDRIAAPVLAVPGNHDISPYQLVQRFADPYRRWRAFVSADTEPQWRDGEVAVLGLNTAQRMALHWNWARGRFTPARLSDLVRRLGAVPERLTRIVVAHHPLLPPEKLAATPVAFGAAVALDVLVRSRVRLVLAGHLHRGYSRLAVAGGRGPLIVQASTATSSRLRGEPNAYNRITIEADGEPTVKVRIWDGRTWIERAEVAPGVGLQPTTQRLTAACSTN